jgi:hypothetical protein
MKSMKSFASESTSWHVRCQSAHTMQSNFDFEPTPLPGEKDEQFSAGNNPAAGVTDDSGTPVASPAPDESLTGTKPNLDALAYHSVLKQLVDHCRKQEQIPGHD